jgi:hypothetical protein
MIFFFYFTALLKGRVDIRVHDEIYSKIHFGFINIDLDFYSARLCFKGSANYGINIVQVHVYRFTNFPCDTYYLPNNIRIALIERNTAQ